jgi:hypothetical protein
MRALARVLVLLAFLLPDGVLAQSTLVRLGEVEAGAPSRVAVATLYDTRIVTAAMAGNAALEVASWDVTRGGQIAKKSAVTENGVGNEFVVVNIGNKGVVTAYNAANGRLRLLSWSVGADGALRRTGAIGAGDLKRLAVAAIGDRRIVTASQNATGATKLIIWDIDAAGAFTRRGDAAGPPGSVVAVAAVSPDLIGTAVRNQRGALEVTAYALDAAGMLTPVGGVEGEAISETAIAATARDRVVTASRLMDGSVKIDAWTMRGAKPSLLGSSTDASAEKLTAAVFGGVKALAAGIRPDGRPVLTSWQVAEQPVKLDAAVGAAATSVALTTLGWDRVVTAAIGRDGKLKLTAWGDQAVGLLHTTWDATSPVGSLCGTRPSRRSAGLDAPVVVAQEPEGDDDDDKDDGADKLVKPPSKKSLRAIALADRRAMAQATRRDIAPGTFDLASVRGLAPSPAPALSFEPDIRGVDPMIAAGRDYVVVSQDHWIEFIAKTGDKAGSQLPSKAGEPTCLATTAFFAGFTRPLGRDKSANLSNINLYQRHPLNVGPGLQCDETDAATKAPCINEFYDTRVLYDPYRGRFIIEAAARGGTWLIDQAPQLNLLARRYIAIAVSRTEDPRDGFDQWITTEANHTDWPRIATADGVLVAANNACKGSDAICGKDVYVDVPFTAQSHRPMAVVFNMDDMVAGKERPRNWKAEPDDVNGGGTVIPVIHRGPTNGWTYFIALSHGEHGPFSLFGFRQTADWSKKPALKQSSITIQGGMNGFREAAIFQAGKVYFSAADQVAARKPDVGPARFMTRVMRIDVSTTATGVALAHCPGPGCLTLAFGERDGGDAAGDLLSYEMPSIAVNAAGDMLIVHARVPVTTAKPVPQEVRYRVFYHDQRGLQDGALLHAGDRVLTQIYCTRQGAERVATPENYYHLIGPFTDAAGVKVCPGQRTGQDYATAAVDANGTDFWMTHAFAHSGAYKMAAGKVTP